VEFVAGADIPISLACACGGAAGVSTTVACWPVAQGGIERNSSNVRTRVLQHFQPVSGVSKDCFSDVSEGWSADTFLPFMKDGRSWMMKTIFVDICEDFATATAHTFLSHDDRSLPVSSLEHPC
jgi:hypothetical protein